MVTIADEQQFQKRISFYQERIRTCKYRFYDMIQTRTKEVSKLDQGYQDQSLHQQVQDKVLKSANKWINCLRGQHYTLQIPQYLQQESDKFKRELYTRLQPKFYLEDMRLNLLEKIFNFREGIL